MRPDERVVAYITGHGLKTLDAVAPTVGPTAVIAPDARRVPRGVRPARPIDRARSSDSWPSPSASPPSCASSPAARPRSALEGGTVDRACSQQLEAAHPGFAERLYDD